MEKFKSKYPEEKVGDTSRESGDALPSPSSKLLSQENNTPEEGINAHSQIVGHDLLAPAYPSERRLCFHRRVSLQL